MQLDEFIFSKKPTYRIARHLAFWLIYFTLFWLQSFAARKYSELFEGDTYYFAFLNVCAFGPVSVLLVYLFIYVLLPYLRQQRYFHFFFFFFLLYAAGTIINYYTAGIFLNTVTYSIPIEANFQHRLEFGNYNTRWGMIIAIIALGIKLTKDWYLQQKENLKILSKKTRTEMQLQKSRIHPDLLFRSLKSIYTNIQVGSNNSNMQILNLSDLLSYSLYESEVEYVFIEKELLEVNRLIALENLNSECPIDVKVELVGNVSVKLIVPMIIVKLVEQCISLQNDTDVFCQRINLNISAGDTLLIVLSIYKKGNFLSTEDGVLFTEGICKRLNEHYTSEDYQIDFLEDAEKVTIELGIKLSNAKEIETTTSTVIQHNKTYDPA